MTHHSVEEMAEDNLSITDVKNAFRNWEIVQVIKDDPCCNRYIINGTGSDNITPIGIVGRFKETGIFLIITVYEITDDVE